MSRSLVSVILFQDSLKIDRNINLGLKSHPSFSEHQWLQLDLGPPTLVTGIVTKGRGDKRNWVTSYSVSYSNDTKIWFYYKDANHLEAKVDPNNGSLLSSGEGREVGGPGDCGPSGGLNGHGEVADTSDGAGAPRSL